MPPCRSPRFRRHLRKSHVYLNLLLDFIQTHLNFIAQVARWTDQLSEEDLAFLKRFVLASGTLKALASEYGISYPTIRLRLDRLIEKVRLLDQVGQSDRFEQQLSSAYADGRLDHGTFVELLAAHRKERERTQ